MNSFTDDDDLKQTEQSRSKTLKLDIAEKSQQITESDVMKFTIKQDEIDQTCLLYRMLLNDGEIMYKEALIFMEKDRNFRDCVIETFKQLSFKAYLWETVPVSQESLAVTPFLFVITESKGLDEMAVDDKTFAQHFNASKNPHATSFLNLGRDAMLVAPLPTKSNATQRDYSHLGNFVRNAPEEQFHEFLMETAKSMQKRLPRRRASPLWLSTAGHGVAWLHARIDESPKYYSYTPFKTYKDATKLGAGGPSQNTADPVSQLSSTKKSNLHGEGSKKYDWSITEGFNNHGQIMKYHFTYEDTLLTYSHALVKLNNDPTFRKILASVFRDCQHDTFVWETVPVWKEKVDDTIFEVAFVNVSSEEVDDCNNKTSDAETSDISRMLETRNEEIFVRYDHSQTEFSAVIPNSFVNKEFRSFYHIGEFMRNAPETDIDEFWKSIGKATTEVLEENPKKMICLSSNHIISPSLVPWMYARIDLNAEKYLHQLYKTSQSVKTCNILE